MAGAQLSMICWVCHVTVTVCSVSGNGGDVGDPNSSPADVTGVTAPAHWPCGDNLCVCSEFHRADCSGHRGKLTYVPKLPGDMTEVDLSDNDFTSETLTGGFFANLTHVRTLHLSRNNISWLPRTVFKDMKQLRTLHLGGNKALTPVSLREMLFIQTLTYVSAKDCNLPPPAPDLFEGTPAQIYSFYLDSNPHGGTYNLEGFCHVQDLHVLRLNGCDFKEITCPCQMQTLSTLYLSSNALRRFPKTCIRKGTSMFPGLIFLSLHHNRIEALSTADICLPSLIRLDLSYNFIKLYPSGTFSSMKFPQLEKLILQHQSSYWDMFVVSSKIEDHAFDNPNLQELDLSHNELDFADCKSIRKHAFANSHKLQELHLDSNNFTHVNDQRFSELFGHLKFLKAMVISNSKFEILSKKTFASFHKMNTLVLDNNIISSIPDGVFDSMHGLYRLFLDNNRIQTLNEQTFSTETRDRLSDLTLGFNPFTCSCELLWFQQWFLTESKFFRPHYIGANDYRCQNIPDMALANFTMTKQACLLSQEFSLFIVQGSSVTILILMLGSLLFRYRWHLRLLMYEVFRGKDDARRVRLLANNFDFDVFLSYASEDLPWVRQQLMPKLEEELGLRLCVHERDFMVGLHVVDNIVQCVDGSKKILMVFSQHFVRSQWCQFELALCLSHVMDYDDALIVVCVDDVTSRQMTSAMTAVLKTTTYVQWREEEDAEASFWGRLHLALNEIVPRGGLYV
ncbi:hypothetical protein ACOMHN_027073 [Nucella lapillus]